MKKYFIAILFNTTFTFNAFAETDNYFSLRSIFQNINKIFSEAFNSLIDFNLYPLFILIAVFGFTLFILLFWPWIIVKKFIQDLNNWKKYHIGQKIMHPIWHIIMILTWFLFIWIFFIVDGGVWSNL